MDNFNRLRTGVDPQNPDLSVNTTAVAVLHIPRPPAWPGHLTLSQLAGAMDGVLQSAAESARRLHDLLAYLRSGGLVREQCRAPLDVLRKQVRSLQWRPLMIAPLEPGTLLDLLKVMATLRYLAARSGGPVPLAVDMKIHYYLYHFMYNRAYARWDIATWLRPLPLLYGAWHPFKYVCTMLYRRFLPLLCLGARFHWEPTVGTVVPRKVKLIHVEKLILSLALAYPAVSGAIKFRKAGILADRRSLCVALARLGPDELVRYRTRHGLDAQDAREERGIVLLDGLQTLMGVYCPAAFRIGVLVRELNWNGRQRGSGANAGEALEISLLLLMVLCREEPAHQNEYVKTLVIALLGWQPYMAELYGCMHGEECGEALLSRLVAAMKRLVNWNTVDLVNQLFLTIPHVAMGEKDLAGRLTEASVERVRGNVRRLIQYVCDDDLPLALWTPASKAAASQKVKYARADACGAVKFPVPPEPGIVPSVDELTTVLKYALRLLVGGPPATVDVRAYLDAHVPLCTPTEMADRHMAHQQVLLATRPAPKPAAPAKPGAPPGPPAPRPVAPLAPLAPPPQPAAARAAPPPPASDSSAESHGGDSLAGSLCIVPDEVEEYDTSDRD